MINKEIIDYINATKELIKRINNYLDSEGAIPPTEVRKALKKCVIGKELCDYINNEIL